MRWLYTVGFFLIVILLTPQTADAVQVFLDTDNAVHNPADVFYIPIRIDTQNECINAVTVAISYNPKEITVQEVSTGDSVISLWTKTPTIERTENGESGRVILEGGIPGGFCGRVVGDPGQTNILAKLVVSGVEQNLIESTTSVTHLVVDTNTKVYLHDGAGTEASTTVLGLVVTFAESTSTAVNPWLDDVKTDTVSPELFEIILVEGPSAGNNKHYIAFNTTDKQSGVDHYEVLETDPDRFGFLTWVPRESYWVPATSPFVLRDQNLRSKIMVKAVDKNGNERVVTYVPEMSPFEELTQPRLLIPIVVSILVVILFIIMSVRFFREKYTKKRMKN